MGLGKIQVLSDSLQNFEIQWNPSRKVTQDGGLSKDMACHEG